MDKKPDLLKELRNLGSDLGDAVGHMRKSKEFKDLEKEISASVKSISSSLITSLKAAKNSESTSKIKKRLGRVLVVGSAQGKEEAKKAQAAAAVGVRKMRAAVKTFKQRFAKSDKSK